MLQTGQAIPFYQQQLAEKDFLLFAIAAQLYALMIEYIEKRVEYKEMKELT